MIKPPVTRIQPSTIYRVERLLPTEGEVIARVGDSVHPETPVARVLLPAPPVNVPVAEVLGVRSKDLAAYLVKQVGDQVRAEEVIARKRPTLLQSKRECVSPIDGIIEYVSYDLGQVTIRQPARPSTLWAEAVGRVTEVVPRKAVVVETGAAVVQGAFGAGGEVYGQLKVLVRRPDELISLGQLDRSSSGCIIVGGGVEHDGVLARAQAVGVRGLILGTVMAAGHERWPVAGEAFSPTVVVTDGFGEMGVYPPAFDVLFRNQGRQTWLRPASAGRADIVVLLSDETSGKKADLPTLGPGSRVRIIRPPFSGSTGRVVGLPRLPRALDSGIRALVAEIETDDGRRIVAPVANLEVVA